MNVDEVARPFLTGIVVLGTFAACGSRSDVGGARTNVVDAGSPFPVGTYTQCAFGTVSSGPFLIPSGFDEGATLTVSANGDARKATFVDAGGHAYTWSFSPTTSVSAVLAPSGQSTDGFGESICVYGVGVSNEKFFPTTLDATYGALTYDSGAMFVSLEGDLTSHTDCGDVSAPAAAWIGCTGGPAPAISVPPASSTFPTGDYACTSQVGTHGKIMGLEGFITSGSSGTLTLAQTGAHVTASYADKELDGTLDFTMNDATTATALANQTFNAKCEPDPTPATLSISAASLSTEGGTVFLSFAGTTNECSGAEKIATLVCTK